mmetsp:Transcript_4219/g.10874  ORF Transcript_4219/g.10874 Transcript_4219/m.10874 type:complete len:168 (-) Transcript_4219:177-680(-)
MYKSSSHPVFSATFGKTLPGKGACRSASTTRLPPIDGPGMLGPDWDEPFTKHTYTASLGPERGMFRNTQGHFGAQPRKPKKKKTAYLLGEALQTGPRPPATSYLDNVSPIACYGGLIDWAEQRSPARNGRLGGHKRAVYFGRSPTGRGGKLPLGMDSVSLPRVVPGF